MAQKPGHFRANFFDARYWSASGAIGGVIGKYFNSRYFLSREFKAPYWIRSSGLAPPPVGTGLPYALPFLATIGMLMTRSGGVFAAAATGAARQWVTMGVYVNMDATSRQWMTGSGMYVN